MTVNEKIIEALSSVGVPVTPDFNGGGKQEYITFNFADDRAVEFGDDAPLFDVAYMQIHYFLPSEKNYRETKKRIRKLLFDAGFTFPDVTEVTEGKKRHLVFECEIENEYEMEE